MRIKDELASGVQTIQYQINTLMTTNGQSPFVTLFLELDEKDEYLEETAQIIEEILAQRLQGIKNEAGFNRFILSVKQWVEKTNSIGIVARAGRYGGTYAHKDIAFEFASWVSRYFKLYLIKEFERLKEEEQKKLGWDIKRNLAKINYGIHTDAIKNKLVPDKLSKEKINFIYASEADLLNVSLFGITAKEWRDENSDLKGNIRDYADISQLVCLSNLENLNAVFINEYMSQSERLEKLNAIAIEQMKILSESESIKKLK